MDRTERIDALLAQMTPAEKAGQLTQYFYFTLPEGALGDVDVAAQRRNVERALADGTAGSVLFVTNPAVLNRLQTKAVENSRLGIGALVGFDVVHGLRTIFPVPVALAATWDPDLVRRAQAVAAREARAVGIHWTFAPMIDVARDPRWGRMVEGAGEDPYLGAAMAAAQVRGFQGPHLGADGHVVAGPKHLAGYGAALGGRDYDEVHLSDAELWNIYLPPFVAAVDAGAGNVMTAYMSLNGVPASANRWLVDDVLRGELGFEGFVVSDANAVKNLVTHGLCSDPLDAATYALGAGVDMEMAESDAAYAQLPAAFEADRATAFALERSVRRVLDVKDSLGLLDDPYVDLDAAADVLSDPAHRELSRLTAERAAVLLRNNGVLPLRDDRLGSIAVLGPLAASTRDILGPWVFDFDLSETISITEALQARAAPGLTVSYAPGVSVAQRTHPSLFDMFAGNVPSDPDGFDEQAEFTLAVDLAASSDVAVVVVGEWQNMIGEMASRATLDLPGRQLELVQAVVATETPVVLVVMNGRPLDLRWADDHVDAIIDIWYPGTHGGHAVANLLFGDVNPSGKLPFTWPRTVGQVPLTYNHTTSHDPGNQGRRYWDQGSTPLYPFGHGLSYTAFAYANIAVSAPAVDIGETVTASVEITNTGHIAGTEVAQLYLHQRTAETVRPVRELKGFCQVTLAPGETQTVYFDITAAERRYWSTPSRAWVNEAAAFDVWIGGDSTATTHTTFRTRQPTSVS